MGIVQQWSSLAAGLPQRALGLAVWLAAMALAFGALERWRPIRHERFLRDGFGADVALYFAGGILPAYFMVAATAAMAWFVGGLVPGALHVWIERIPVALRLLAMIVLGDVAYYWAHRWSHEVPWLWRFHRVHHQPEHLDWLVNTRAHVFDLVFIRTISTLPLLALGLVHGSLASAGQLVALYLAISTVWAFFIHANVRCRLGWLEHVVVSPAFHHWHHSNERSNVALNRNYASLLPGLDRLFGTHHLPARDFPASYGLAGLRGGVRCPSTR